MSVNFSTLYPLFLKELPVNGINGVSSPQLAAGLAQGLSSFILGGINIVTVDAGTIVSGSPGAGTGTINVNPGNILLDLLKEFPSSAILGIFAAPLANAIAQATSNSYSSCTVVSVHPTVSNGSGTGVAVPSAAYPFISLGFKSVALTGVFIENLSLGISRALESSLSTASINVFITGPISTTPSSGSGTGRLT